MRDERKVWPMSGLSKSMVVGTGAGIFSQCEKQGGEVGEGA